MADAADEPIFALHGPAWRPGPAESLRLLAVGQGAIFLLTSPPGMAGPSRLHRYSVATGETEELELARTSGTPSGLFADPHSGASLIVSYGSGDNVYVHRARSRVLGKAKGLLITAVAWLRPDPSRAETRDVLLGTSTGAIYDAALEPARTTRYRQVFSLSPAAPIFGLQAEVFSPGGQNGHAAPATERRRLFVMAATPTRYYEFVGPASAELLFAEYRDISQLGYVEVRNT